MRGRIRFGVMATLAVSGGLLLTAAPASASDVEVNGQEVNFDGDNDADVATVSTDGTTITITDTGLGGVTTGDPDCTQVNATVVTCPAVLPGESPISRIFADLEDGVDSFTNQNLVTEFASIGASGDTGAKTISGGPGSQNLFGGIDGDNLNGGEGSDSILDGSSQIEGGGTAGNDVVAGGPGDDSTTYFRDLAPALSITLDGVANDGQAGEADNVDVENVTTGAGNDTLVGDGNANLLTGFGGNDVIRGGGGNDELFGDFGFGGGLILARRGGPAIASGSDTLEGGSGRDGLDCGPGLDVALIRDGDDAKPNCERVGATVVGDSSSVSKKNKFKVDLRCAAEEVETCKGKVKVTSAGKKIGKGKFSVKAGKTKGARAKLSKKGSKALRKAGGSLLVTIVAKTTEPGGVAENSGRVLIHR